MPATAHRTTGATPTTPLDGASPNGKLAQPANTRRPTPDAITHFSWDGNRLLTEQQLHRAPGQSEPQLQHRLYIYEPDSFVPLAQVQTLRAPDDPDNISRPDPDAASLHQQHHEIWANNVIPLQKRIAARLKNTLPKEPKRPASTTEIFYYHTDHLGTPRELTDTEGHIAWEARYQAWGRAHRIDYPAIPHVISDGNIQRQIWVEPQSHERPVQNLRFQGQYHDEETGLHYNRFRYYDPDVGRFASQDPIGLAGGVNTYQHAPNPVVWVDPLGLCKCPGVVATSETVERILQAERAGSGLKDDAAHRAASFLSREQLLAGKTFPLRGGDGVERTLLQTKGGLNGKNGIYEYILDSSGKVTHQRFIDGGIINGLPNQRATKAP